VTNLPNLNSDVAKEFPYFSTMKPTRTDTNRHCLRCLFLIAFLISLSACAGTKKTVQGKWEANIVSKRSGQGSKAIFEFLPDGTFNAMPPGDTTIVDKDKYQVLDEGRTVKFRSQLFGGDAVCKFSDDAIECEADNARINFKRL
jgi:hypothetical protein